METIYVQSFTKKGKLFYSVAFIERYGTVQAEYSEADGVKDVQLSALVRLLNTLPKADRKVINLPRLATSEEQANDYYLQLKNSLACAC